MPIRELFAEIDYLVMHNFGDLAAALETERGKWILSELLSVKNRVHLRHWYDSLGSLNPGAEAVKDELERLSGERLWPPPIRPEGSEKAV